MLLGTIRACFLERLLGDKELIGVKYGVIQ